MRFPGYVGSADQSRFIGGTGFEPVTSSVSTKRSTPEPTACIQVAAASVVTDLRTYYTIDCAHGQGAPIPMVVLPCSRRQMNIHQGLLRRELPPQVSSAR